MYLISLPLFKRDLGLHWPWEWLAGAEMQREAKQHKQSILGFGALRAQQLAVTGQLG